MTADIDDVRLQLAFAGLHPDRSRRLIDDHGHAGALRRLVKGGVEDAGRSAEAAAVDATERRHQLAALGLTAIVRGGAGYPERLADLPDAPDLLFVRGAAPDMPTVAVVGTRRCTAYGRALAREYGQVVAEAGWCLVSGLARGIDGAAHEGTVVASGAGVAVLGSGLDVLYPAEHRDLASDLVDRGGAVISEYPPGTIPEPWRFPPRNRIISGMADAVVVVEAAVKGGALITAGYALSHGRPVFAVPGDVRRATSEGCNLLIRDGAHPVLGPEDLIEELTFVLGLPVPPPPGGVTFGEGGDT